MDANALPLVLVKFDGKGMIKEVSHATPLLLGFNAAYYVGKNFASLFGLFEEEAREEKGGFHLFEHGFKTEMGEDKYLAWRFFPIEVDEQLAMAWDITSFKQKSDGIFTAKKEAEAASQAKSDFIAHTSHELRTPLNAVIGYSEMLLDEVEDADPIEVKHDLEKINAAAKHLLSLINSVLDLSKIEAGKMELFNEDFDLKNLLVEVGATVEILAKKRRNQLDVSYPETLGQMYGDRTKLRQILFNLLSNACKFTEGGKIILRAQIVGSMVSLSVEDTGCGMTEEELKKIFIPYSQVGIAQKKKVGTGTGLGLMLSKRLSEMMGGQIAVTSQYNKGTTFTVDLPFSYRPPAKEKVRASDTVLVIDDDPAVHEILKHVLKKENLKVASAMNGEMGLRLAKETQPLAIILDLVMPVMNGWEVLVKLKEDPQLKEIPVVVSTGDDSADPQARQSIKVDEYLVKPINSSLLVAVLNRYRPLAEEKYTLLVVDDDKETRNIVVRIAEKEGWKTMEAADGSLALKSLQQKKPHLILLDLMMPVMNGFEFVQNFRKKEDLKAIPIVVLTSKDLTSDERKYLGGFAHHIIEKESGMENLKEIIKEIGSQDGQNINR